MAETTKNTGDKLSVTPTKTLTLKPRVEQGMVRQSFSHGRSKAGAAREGHPPERPRQDQPRARRGRSGRRAEAPQRTGNAGCENCGACGNSFRGIAAAIRRRAADADC